MQAVFLNDALITLGIADREALVRLHPHLQSTVESLTGANRVRRIWNDFVDILITKLPVKPSNKHARTALAGLQNLRARSQVARDQLVPGLTCHQAKGKEWDTVGVRLEENAAALYNGLVLECEEHRSLYVALTRARRRTVASDPPRLVRNVHA
ncbi:3'-5' exonuclease [Streptomyces sp. NPDC058755]|uniref:3'-5' exonuclease n=1 Tax=Streptomyces sp. NPDC058755 TaxID=3346624 RepID=UPI0036A1D572